MELGRVECFLGNGSNLCEARPWWEREKFTKHEIPRAKIRDSKHEIRIGGTAKKGGGRSAKKGGGRRAKKGGGRRSEGGGKSWRRGVRRAEDLTVMAEENHAHGPRDGRRTAERGRKKIHGLGDADLEEARGRNS